MVQLRVDGAHPVAPGLSFSPEGQEVKRNLFCWKSDFIVCDSFLHPRLSQIVVRLSVASQVSFFGGISPTTEELLL
jgi:hypothetical protein